jgi:hypothetical protein
MLDQPETLRRLERGQHAKPPLRLTVSCGTALSSPVDPRVGADQETVRTEALATATWSGNTGRSHEAMLTA